jgi:hypothetical protein
MKAFLGAASANLLTPQLLLDSFDLPQSKFLATRCIQFDGKI